MSSLLLLTKTHVPLPHRQCTTSIKSTSNKYMISRWRWWWLWCGDQSMAPTMPSSRQAGPASKRSQLRHRGSAPFGHEPLYWWGRGKWQHRAGVANGKRESKEQGKAKGRDKHRAGKCKRVKGKTREEYDEQKTWEKEEEKYASLEED